jgi:hypothetical protein
MIAALDSYRVRKRQGYTGDRRSDHCPSAVYQSVALASASQGQNSVLILIIIAAVITAAFWRTILKIGIAVVIIGFTFLLVTGTLDFLHAMQKVLF